MIEKGDQSEQGMYLPQYEHDACGIGLITNIKKQRSHKIVRDGLLMLQNMEHRGGCGAEPETGDGAGITIEIPFDLFENEAEKSGLKLPEQNTYGVGVIFYPKDSGANKICRSLLHRYASELSLNIIWERPVPVDNTFAGPSAQDTEPYMEHLFISGDSSWDNALLERKLYLFKKYVSREIQNKGFDGFYMASLSTKQIVYKGQLRTDQLSQYFLDLSSDLLVSCYSIVHSRFSTNTFPKWSLAQPFRYIAHNGEINTIRGNVNKMKAKEALLASPYFTEEEVAKLLPICDLKFSDSANLDELIELLIMSGRSLPHALMMLIPEAWELNKQMDESRKAFFKYHASMMEPWDGPAAVCFSDGNLIGATLDRNGLRPCRYIITHDDRLIISSEVGAVFIDPSLIKEKGRLEPGKMLLADLSEGKIYHDEEIKKIVTEKQPYSNWIKQNRIKLKYLIGSKNEPDFIDQDKLKYYQNLAGYTEEDLKMILMSMAVNGKEPIGSMGSDVPLAVFSKMPQHPANFLKQMFAQVSNPPIDSLRERLVMSLFTRVGENKNILIETPEHCRQVHITQPVLKPSMFQKILELTNQGFDHQILDATFSEDESLLDGLNRICDVALDATQKGTKIMIISDELMGEGKMPIPSLIATGAIQHHLIKHKVRAKTSLIVKGADIIETHHFAAIIGYGASGVYPYLAFNSLKMLKDSSAFEFEELCDNYTAAVGNGLLKIMSKMGISTLQSYQGSQIFEAVGLADDLIEKCFRGTVSRIGGASFDTFEKYARQKYADANNSDSRKQGGIYQWRRDAEKHIIDPEAIHLLQKSLKLKDYDLFKKYSSHINERSGQFFHLRNLMDFKKTEPIPINEVESAAEILKRFATGAMSFGSISYEAHTTLAIAMNRIGARSNSGEGGEDERRYTPLENGDFERSAIKQVASGRFGVTSYYLNIAIEIQIKVAQGAKPGEGGQLPGHKVDDWIGKVRMSTPGVDLISPPPHHDIYSIEDLAQLIFDLKNANPDARVNVKLVAEAGVGTIAAGVAKGFADAILISGANGGTGASPLSSLMHAGMPWEMGLAEAHQTLVKNKLRSRVVLQTDGKLMTGRDLAIATLLGAEEWGISTIALIAEGCIMMRKCHLNTCPVGIANQDPDLRNLFSGDPDHVVNLFEFLVEELREVMAELGFKTIQDMVGQSHLLEANTAKTKEFGIDLSKLVYFEEGDKHDTYFKSKNQQNLLLDVLDRKLIQDAAPAFEEGLVATRSYRITNTDRTVGAMLSSKISRAYGAKGLPEELIHYKFRGSAGQSFGAFVAHGVRFMLEGDANDYLGKSLSGGKLIVYPSLRAKIAAEKNTIIGNVALYGATSGEVYISGRAGERFAVRNSGATAVVEGVGDHGCEYMTGGYVVIMGAVGKNFAAGMSGGVAYVFDTDGTLQDMYNDEMVILDQINAEDMKIVKKLVINHLKYTNSPKSEAILLNWDSHINQLKKLIPVKYKEIMEAKKAAITI
jgi:glutamate synthase (NADPH/NADH) large chain